MGFQSYVNALHNLIPVGTDQNIDQGATATTPATPPVGAEHCLIVCHRKPCVVTFDGADTVTGEGIALQIGVPLWVSAQAMNSASFMRATATFNCRITLQYFQSR